MLSSIYVLVPQCLFPAFSIIIISEYMSLSPLGSGTSLGICTHIISFNISICLYLGIPAFIIVRNPIIAPGIPRSQ